MTPIFCGNERLIKKNDDWNYYASQLRIRLEMALGMYVNKWGIFSCPIKCGIKNLRWLALGAARLHNFCINERMLNNQPEESDHGGINFTPSTLHHEDSSVLILNPSDKILPGISVIHSEMVEDCKRRKLYRPKRN